MSERGGRAALRVLVIVLAVIGTLVLIGITGMVMHHSMIGGMGLRGQP